jgi:hypothetical protein
MIGTHRRKLLACLGAAIIAFPTHVSDPVGVYALVDRVVLEPDSLEPRRIQVWGVFAVAVGMVETKSMAYPEFNAYRPAERGYMYFTIDRAEERQTLAEWRDLQQIAGTGDVTGFGRRFSTPGKVRRASERPTAPDIYVTNAGPTRFRAAPSRVATHGVDYVPSPTTPADGGRAAPGSVRLVARMIRDSNVTYTFQIEGPGGVKETSPPLRPERSATEIAFTPDLQLRDGAQYNWRVWVNRDGFTAPPAIATFRVAR